MVTTSAEVRLDDATFARRAEGANGRAGEAAAAGKAFTDSDISRGAGGAGRELERWVPDADGPKMADLSLGGRGPHGGAKGGWDQFEANKRLYGVQSTFKEELYTTSLDKSNSRISAAEADRIAREIEGQGANGNMHLAEERGHVIDGTSGEMDEEDRYSSVLDSSRPGQAKLPAARPAVGGARAAEAKPAPPGAAPPARAGPAAAAETPDAAAKDGAPKAPAAAASKLNPNAKEFKLNANAASFTPGAKKPAAAAPLVPPPVQGPHPHQMIPQFGGNEFGGAAMANPAMYMQPMMPGGYFPGQAAGMGAYPPGAPHMANMGFPQQMRFPPPQQQHYQQQQQQQQQGGGGG